MISNQTASFIKALEIFILTLLTIPTITAMIKGAPWVPTPMSAVKKMLKLAKLKPGEKVVDLGCGDGRIVYLANKLYQCDATGYELSPLIYFWAKIRQLFWRSHARVKFRNFKTEDLSKINVIFCYLLPACLKEAQKKFDQELAPGTRIISYAFPIGNWKERHQEPRDKENRVAPIWVYEIEKTNNN